MLGSPFKQRAHYVFNYKPRYYDERKERLQNLEQKYKSESETSEEDDYSISLSKSHLRNNWSKTKSNGSDASSSKRLAIIIAVLIGLFAYIFQLHTLI
jgi:hypothetical protein